MEPHRIVLPRGGFETDRVNCSRWGPGTTNGKATPVRGFRYLLPRISRLEVAGVPRARRYRGAHFASQNDCLRTACGQLPPNVRDGALCVCFFFTVTGIDLKAVEAGVFAGVEPRNG